MTVALAEPIITVNGHALTPGEAMTVRVALEAFALSLTDPESLADFDFGTIGPLYRAAISRIRNYMSYDA